MVIDGTRIWAMVTKNCSKCGITWPVAKRWCTCGQDLRKSKDAQHKPRRRPKKACTECGKLWSCNKSLCSCGNRMITNSKKRKRGSWDHYKCGVCGRQKTRGGHACTTPSLVLPPRAAKISTNYLEEPAPPCEPSDNESQNDTRAPDELDAPAPPREPDDTTPPRPVMTRLLCGVCKLRMQLEKLSKSTNIDSLKTQLQDIQLRAQNEIALIRDAVQEAKDRVSDLTRAEEGSVDVPEPRRACAFTIMRAASKKANQKRTASSPKPPKPKQIDRSKGIRDALRAKRDSVNAAFLKQIVEGKLELHAARTTESGKLIRPSAVQTRMSGRRRLNTAVRGLLDASGADASTLVWIFQSLYQVDGFTQVIDVALVQSIKTVPLTPFCSLSYILFPKTDPNIHAGCAYW